MSALCCQKNLKGVAGRFYLGSDFIEVIPVFKACVSLANSFESIPDQIAFYTCRATPHAFANQVT
jgi:hypothetical protein